MFGEPVRSASRTSGKQATTPRVAREVWAVLIAAVLVSLSFWWETAYEFKHAYYIDIESREKPLDAPWHKYAYFQSPIASKSSFDSFA